MRPLGLGACVALVLLPVVGSCASVSTQRGDICERRLANLEVRVRANQACEVDNDCEGFRVRPAPGCCCYAASASWVGSAEQLHLVEELQNSCARFYYGCRGCSVACVGSVCRPKPMANANPYCGTGAGAVENEHWSPDQWLDYVNDGGR